MTYEEAKICIKANICYKQEVCDDGICKSTEERPCAIEIANECIEKQIPKKPKAEIYIYPRFYTDVKDDEYDLLCPCCGEYLMEYDHHCKCGQAIDWSVVER